MTPRMWVALLKFPTVQSASQPGGVRLGTSKKGEDECLARGARSRGGSCGHALTKERAEDAESGARDADQMASGDVVSALVTGKTGLERTSPRGRSEGATSTEPKAVM
eukprot:scaffold160887_cov32-Tisochrysis_lutea.AAC.1